jgi:outer membrane protein OmpA-like peptidoglycan-associated protein
MPFTPQSASIRDAGREIDAIRLFNGTDLRLFSGQAIRGEEMPLIETREAMFVIAIGLGVAATGIAQAEPVRFDRPLILAQNTQQPDETEEERRKKRRERKQEEGQEQKQEQPGRAERRERVQQQPEQKQEQPGRAERRERVQQQPEQKQEQPGRAERRERVQQQPEQKQEKPGRAERRERVQQQPEQKQEKPGRAERRERVQQEPEQKQEKPGRAERRERVQQEPEQKQEKPGRAERRERVQQDRKRIERPTEKREFSNEEREDRRKVRREFTRDNLKDITSARRERREAGGRVIIEEPGKRRIIRDKGRVIIEHDETQRLRGASRDVRVNEGPGGRKRTVITRANGVQIISVEGRDGRLLRRIKRFPNGREVVLINNEFEGRKRFRDRDRNRPQFYVDLPELRVDLSRRDYYAYADDADEEDIYDLLTAEPVEDLEEDYTLDEIRQSPDLRKRFRKLNLNTVNFEFGSWDIREDQIGKLEVVARVINRIVDEDPEQILLIGGYTDAVGSVENNLSLSDRRAETVARVLTDEFGVPPENLVTQGYGESNLLIETEGPEIRNRRVEFMRITPYLAQNEN